MAGQPASAGVLVAENRRLIQERRRREDGWRVDADRQHHEQGQPLLYVSGRPGLR